MPNRPIGARTFRNLEVERCEPSPSPYGIAAQTSTELSLEGKEILFNCIIITPTYYQYHTPQQMIADLHIPPRKHFRKSSKPVRSATPNVTIGEKGIKAHRETETKQMKKIEPPKDND